MGTVCCTVIAHEQEWQLLGRCISSTEMWIHAFLHVPDVLEQLPWNVSSGAVDEPMLFHPSDAVVIHIGSLRGI